MKRRDHITTVSFLLGAAVFLLMGSAVTAQEFMPPPAFYSGTPSLVYGRFYVQGGLQYRNIQEFGIRKNLRAYDLIQDFGSAPFGTDQEGAFGSGTGVAGYPVLNGNPTGLAADPPSPLVAGGAASGIWEYDSGGLITPNGALPTLDPVSGDVVYVAYTWVPTDVGLGQYVIVVGSANHPGFKGQFIVADPPRDVGFDMSNPPLFSETRRVNFQRVLDATVNGYGTGRESIIWRSLGQEIRDREYALTPLSPTIEVGFQWTNFFDFFAGFSWYDMAINCGKSYNITANLWHRGIRDNFPFYSNREGNWANAPHDSSFISTTEGNSEWIFPDTPQAGVYPYRTFFYVQDFGAQPMAINETISIHTDVRVYEYKLGVRSWVPLYGLGRFGIVAGPLLNQINYEASVNRRTTYPLITGTVVVPESVFHNGVLLSFGAFAGGDLEVAYGQYFGKFGAFYNITEQKTITNADTGTLSVDSNLNLSGFNMAFNLGCRF